MFLYCFHVMNNAHLKAGPSTQLNTITDTSNQILAPKYQYTRALIVQSHTDQGVCVLIVKDMLLTPR